jgi:hypothetical protein
MNQTGWWLTYPSEKYESQMGVVFPIYGNIENVPNHQPAENSSEHLGKKTKFHAVDFPNPAKKSTISESASFFHGKTCSKSMMSMDPSPVPTSPPPWGT